MTPETGLPDSLNGPKLGWCREFRWSQAVDATPGAKGEREA